MKNQPIINRIELRENKETGEKFAAVILRQLLPIVSVNGNVRISNVEYSVPSNETVANLLPSVGMAMPGSIVRVPCAPYQWDTPDGESMTLAHTYAYQPNGSAHVESPASPAVFQAPQPEFPVEATA